MKHPPERLAPLPPSVKHRPHAVGRAIVCYKNQIRSIGLGSQRVDGYCNGAFFVMGSDDDGQGRPRCVGSWWVHKLIQFAGLPSGEGQKAGIVKDIDKAGAPGSEALPEKGLCDKAGKGDHHSAADQRADQRDNPGCVTG